MLMQEKAFLAQKLLVKMLQRASWECRFAMTEEQSVYSAESVEKKMTATGERTLCFGRALILFYGGCETSVDFNLGQTYLSLLE